MCKESRIRNHCFPLAGRYSATSLGSRASAHTMVTWENKCYNHECPPFLLLSPKLLLLSTMLFGMQHPFDQFGSTVPAVQLASFLCTPRLLAVQTEWGEKLPRKKKISILCNTAHKLPRRWCVINPVLVINPIHMGCYEEN